MALVVNAGPDQTVTVDYHISKSQPVYVTLKGDVGDAPRGSYTWGILAFERDAGYLINKKDLNARLIVFKPGKYQATLIVNDGNKRLAQDITIITVREK